MKILRMLMATGVAVASALALQAHEARLLRFPAVHGDRVVFTYAGDLYTVPLAGGTARQLTAHVGFEMFARFSPDGQTIAFTGQYDGNTEVFAMPSQGGVPRRLTHTATLTRDDVSDRMGPNSIVMAWTPDGQGVVYRSRRHSFNAFVGQLFTVPAQGGMSIQLPLASGGFCSYSPCGRKLAFNQVFREFRTWKFYAGGMADDVRIFNFDTGTVTNITNHPAQDIFPMWIGDEIFFLSDRDRTMNLFAYHTLSGEVSKVTHFTDFDIKFPSHGGSTIVFEKGGYLYAFDAPTRGVQRIPVTITNDRPHARPEWRNASERIFGMDISPDGARVVLSARGDVFTLPSTTGITRNLTQSSYAHDREAVWSPDGRHIAYLSDRSGEYQVYIQAQDGLSAPVAVTRSEGTYKYSITWSPDSQRILWSDRQGRLKYVDVESQRVTQVARGEYGLILSYAWSPDSRWIAYALPGANRFSVIYLYNLNTQQRVAATTHWHHSTQPAFSADGKYLLYVSDRDFNPIYSRTEWNHAFQAMSRVYITMLSADTPSPFAPVNREVALAQGEPGRSRERGRRESQNDSQAGEVEVRVDPEGLIDRTIALPHAPSGYRNVSSVGGMVYYIEWDWQTRTSTLKAFNLEERREVVLGEGMEYVISANGKKMLVAKGQEYSVIDRPTQRITLDERIDLAGMRVWVDYRQEWEQIFHESWRQMRDFFYVANMHGVDWEAMRQKYQVLLPYVNHRADLTYVIGEMISELNVSHTYVNSGRMPTPPRINVGLLGASLSKHPSGYFRVDRILPGANWSKSLRSPLLEVGVNVREGDYIIAVDGVDLAPLDDIYTTLVGKADRIVELTVNDRPRAEGSRRVLVVPVADESDLYYYSWVQGNIRRVTEATNGQVGYIHVPNMLDEGLVEFARHFYPQLNRRALIIDNRGNGGGNVSPMLLERLSRVPHRATMRRGFEQSWPVPRETHIGPKVLLINRYSASDGDLFAYGFRRLGLGTIIGTRTWGGVVGIAASLPFVDGGDLRKPEFASFSAETGEWIIEGYGVDPDIPLDNDPHLEFMGQDQQLEKAIEVILQQLQGWEGLPPIPADPDKSR